MLNAYPVTHRDRSIHIECAFSCKNHRQGLCLFIEGNHELLPYFYNLSDSGHIRFVRNNKKKSLSIGLGSPLIYYHFASNGKDLISLDEAAALKSPVGQPNEDLAENVTLRLLAEIAQKFFKTTN